MLESIRFKKSAFKLFISFALVLALQNSISGQIISTYIGGGENWPFENKLSSLASINPNSTAVDKEGNIYFTDPRYHTIRKISKIGVITTIAGTGIAGYNGDSLPGISTLLNRPIGLCLDTLGNIFFADQGNNRVRKIATSGKISTIAGNGVAGYSGDGGQATLSQVNSPNSIAVDASGSIYISDYGNNRVRKIDSSGQINTIVGGGGYEMFNGKSALLASVTTSNITHDVTGNIYFSDETYNVIRKISTSGIITTIAGNGTDGFSGDGGNALLASISYPGRIFRDATNNLYFVDRGNNRIRRVASNGIITTIAGNGVSGYGGDDSLAVNAKINSWGINGLSKDLNGNIIFIDGYNFRIRSINTAGIITTIAGNGIRNTSGDGALAINSQISSNNSGGLVVNKSGNIFFIDGTLIRKISTSGIISTFSNSFYSSRLVDLSIDAKDNLYTCSFDGLVQKISLDNTITTVSGKINATSLFQPGTGDGSLATLATFNYVYGFDIDTAGNIFLGDLGDFKIRKISTSGIINTFAGTGGANFGGDGGLSSLAILNYPNDIKIDKNKNIYIADYGNYRVRKVTPNGIISTIAGNGAYGSKGDGGVAVNANIDPYNILLDPTGNLYISEHGYNKIRKVDTSGIISTISGTGTGGFSGDGSAAALALIYGPRGMAYDVSGNLYFCDNYNNVIRKISTYGYITSIAGNNFQSYYGDSSNFKNAGIHYPTNLEFDKVGNLYFFDQTGNCIRKVSTAGIISTIGGNGIGGYGGDDGPAKLAQIGRISYSFTYPGSQIAFDESGNLFFTDQFNNRIRKISTNGIITTIAGTGTINFSGDGGLAKNANINRPSGIAIDKLGNIYFSDQYNNRIRKISTSGIITTIAGTGTVGFSGDNAASNFADLNQPTILKVDAIGNIYFVDQNNYRIRKISTNGIITTIAGTGTMGFSGDSALAENAQIGYRVTGLSFGNKGNIIIYDASNYRVRNIDSNGIITTIAGKGYDNINYNGYSGDGGLATDAFISNYGGVAFSSNGTIFIADARNHRIRVLNFPNISISNSDLNFKTCYNAKVIPKSFRVSGSKLTGNITITGSKQLEFSIDSNSIYSTSLILRKSTDTLIPSKVFVRLKDSLIAFNYLDTISIISDGALTKYIYLNDTINQAPLKPKVNDTVFCKGYQISNLTAIANNKSSLLWYGTNAAGGTSSITSSVAITSDTITRSYYVSQIDSSSGCESARAKIIVTISAIPPAPTLSRDNSNYLVASTKGITWYKEGAALADTSQKFKPPSSGSYTAKTTQYGCTSALSTPYYFLVTDIINLSSDEFIKLAPNPFINQLNFDFDIKGYQRLNLEVFDIATGSKKASMQNLTPGMPINLSQLSGGTYIIKVSSNDGKINYQFKMIKL